MSPSDLIRLLEADDPRINSLNLQLSFRRGSVQIRIDRRLVLVSDPDKWEQIGLGMGRCTKLQKLEMDSPIDAGTLPTESMQCLVALYEGLKHNTSVQYLSVFFQGGNDFSIFDWEYFMTNNIQMKCLIISSRRRLQSDEGRAIELAIRSSSSLESLNMQSCTFLDNGVLEQILSACSGIQRLFLECDEMYKCTAVAGFLRNQLTELQRLRHLEVENIVHGGLRIIAESLANNTILERLDIWGSVLCTEDMNTFSRILCNATTLDGIKNSNHTLEEILPDENCSQHVLECLKLNRNENKEEVVRQKIAKYYFAGNFDVSPFASMPLSAIPNVMTTIGGDDPEAQKALQCNAIFKLLKAIPDLSTIGNQQAEESDNTGEE